MRAITRKLTAESIQKYKTIEIFGRETHYFTHVIFSKITPTNAHRKHKLWELPDEPVEPAKWSNIETVPLVMALAEINEYISNYMYLKKYYGSTKFEFPSIKGELK